jgi:membrane carboxypeptidase/penicillin-binding protein PbpC
MGERCTSNVLKQPAGLPGRSVDKGVGHCVVLFTNHLVIELPCPEGAGCPVSVDGAKNFSVAFVRRAHLKAVGRTTLRLANRVSDQLWQSTIDSSARSLARTLELPPHFIQILLAVEDKRFRYHLGVDPIALLRVCFYNLALRPPRPHGGSTITQQIYSSLARRQGSYRPSAGFKARQALWAIRKSISTSKAAALRQYLDSVYFGRSIYGFRRASRDYCARAPHDISPSEGFFLVERIARPNTVCPARISELAARRPIAAVLAAEGAAGQRLVSLYQTHFGCGEVIAQCLEKSLKKSATRTCSSFVVVSSEQ